MNGHASRDRHLFGPGPKRILSLDGGGVRGVISVAFLERIEAILSEQAGINVQENPASSKPLEEFIQQFTGRRSPNGDPMRKTGEEKTTASR